MSHLIRSRGEKIVHTLCILCIASIFALGVTEWRYPLCPIYCSAVNGAFVLYISSDTFRSRTHKGESWPRKPLFWSKEVPDFYLLAILGPLRPTWLLDLCLRIPHICWFSSTSKLLAKIFLKMSEPQQNAYLSMKCPFELQFLLHKQCLLNILATGPSGNAQIEALWISMMLSSASG